jgi:hypothetical protein
MPPRPSIAVKRPSRAAEAIGAPPTPIEPTAIPTIDPDSSDALAFSMRGRANPALETGEGRGPAALAPVDPLQSGSPTDLVDPRAGYGPAPDVAQALQLEGTADSDAIQGLISIKLPPDVGRQLAAIADRRGSKRTLIAIEALSEPLRTLAAAHRAGDFPELPKIVSGTVRSSIAFALPPDLALDLEFVLRARRAVRAQVVTRLLTPAVRALYDSEVGRRGW